jgi:hypothetical protein
VYLCSIEKGVIMTFSITITLNIMTTTTKQQLNLTLEEIVEHIIDPMLMNGRIVIPQQYRPHLFMRYLRRLGEVERFFKRGERSGYRLKYHKSDKLLNFNTLYTLMNLYKTSVMSIKPNRKVNRKTFGDLFLTLLDKGFSYLIIEDMIEIEKLLKEYDDKLI